MKTIGELIDLLIQVAGSNGAPPPPPPELIDFTLNFTLDFF